MCLKKKKTAQGELKRDNGTQFWKPWEKLGSNREDGDQNRGKEAE